MNNKELRLMGVTSAGLQIRANADGTESRTIEGMAIVFGQKSVRMWEEKGKPVVEVISAESITKDLLDRCDIKMTMYHDMSRLLARSKQGKGTLSYDVTPEGVKFSFDAPPTAYGDEALALVRSGDIDGCSFMFTARYGDRSKVERSESEEGEIVYTVREITGIYDFTLTPDPAYPQTECEARSLAACEAEKVETPEPDTDYLEQIAQMDMAAKKRIY